MRITTLLIISLLFLVLQNTSADDKITTQLDKDCSAVEKAQMADTEKKDAKRQNRGYEIISIENSQKLSVGEDVVFSLSQNSGWDFVCTGDPTSIFTDDSRVIPKRCKNADKTPSAKNFIWNVNGRSFILLQDRNFRSPSFMVWEIDNTGFVYNHGQFNPGEYFRYYISNESISFQNEYDISESVVIWLRQ